MARLEDVHNINQLMYKFVDAHDNLDRDAMVSFAAPIGEVIVDVSSHLSIEPQRLSPSDFADFAIRSVAGFTATHHVLANPVVSFDQHNPDKARARMIGIAYHCIQEGKEGEVPLESVTTMAYQTMDVERWNRDWRFRRLAVERTVPLDNPSLYQKARERVVMGLGRPVKGHNTASR